MITIPREKTYSTWANKAKGDAYPCCICGKVSPNPTHMLHLFDDYPPVAVTEKEARDMDPAADLGMYPIGPSCMKKHPELRPYAHVIVKVASEQQEKPATPLDWKELYFDLFRQCFGETTPDREILDDASKRHGFINGE